MSSHPKGTKVRVAADFYETPAWVVAPLLDELYQHMPPMPSVDVLDPGMGAGALGRAVRLDPSWGSCRLTGVELPEEASKHPDQSNTYDTVLHQSFLEALGFWAPKAYDLVICREVLEHLSIGQIRRAVTNLAALSAGFVYVTTRFAKEPDSLLSVDTQDGLDPTHISMLNQTFLRALFVLEGFKRRADLEAAMDWKTLGRVLVYERA